MNGWILQPTDPSWCMGVCMHEKTHDVATASDRPRVRMHACVRAQIGSLGLSKPGAGSGLQGFSRAGSGFTVGLYGEAGRSAPPKINTSSSRNAVGWRCAGSRSRIAPLMGKGPWDEEVRACVRKSATWVSASRIGSPCVRVCVCAHDRLIACMRAISDRRPGSQQAEEHAGEGQRQRARHAALHGALSAIRGFPARFEFKQGVQTGVQSCRWACGVRRRRVGALTWRQREVRHSPVRPSLHGALQVTRLVLDYDEPFLQAWGRRAGGGGSGGGSCDPGPLETARPLPCPARPLPTPHM
jgi:hypothetical protein